METTLVLNETILPTKSEIKEMATQLVERVEEGYLNPLLAYGQITALEEMLKQAKGIIKDQALAEAERYESKTFSCYNMDVQVKETGVKYDYTENQHWRELKEVVDLANAELKGHEEVLKRMGQCAKSSTTSIAITLRK